MKGFATDKKSKYIPEPGEEALTMLIKEAGAEARSRKKMAMANHFKKLHVAICDISIPIQKTNSA